MSLSGPRFEKSEGVELIVREGVERLRNLPGVVSAGATCCVPLQGGYGLAVHDHRPSGAGPGRAVPRRRSVDDDLAGVFRRLQDSRQARSRLHRSRQQRRAGRGGHQRGDGEAVLARQGSAERSPRHRPRRDARVRRRRRAADRRRRRRHARWRAQQRSRPGDVHPAGAGARRRERTEPPAGADRLGRADARGSASAEQRRSRSSSGRRPGCR